MENTFCNNYYYKWNLSQNELTNSKRRIDEHSIVSLNRERKK